VITLVNPQNTPDSPPPAPVLRRQFSLARLYELLVEGVLFCCSSVSIFVTAAILFVLLIETVIPMGGEKPFFWRVSLWEFFTESRWTPTFSEKHFGVLPLVCGTFLVAFIAALVGLPLGILSAIYLSEYARPKTRQIVKPILEILSGLPTVVYGYFALIFVTPYIVQPIFHSLLGLEVDATNALSAGLVMGIMIMPMVCSLSEDAIRAVPRTLREAGYALGSTKYDVSIKVVVPAALSGIVAAFLLAVARAIGETMLVAIAAGNTPQMTLNPLSSIQTMTTFIVNTTKGDTPSGTIEYQSLYAVALCLFVMTFGMNVVSHAVMRRFREVYH
jgi:phosphate transport system permease protein